MRITSSFNLFLAGLFAVIFQLFLFGETRSYHTFWLYTIPIASTFAVGCRQGAIWTAGSLVLIAMMFTDTVFTDPVPHDLEFKLTSSSCEVAKQLHSTLPPTLFCNVTE